MASNDENAFKLEVNLHDCGGNRLSVSLKNNQTVDAFG
jgi:hypothetical protein